MVYKAGIQNLDGPILRADADTDSIMVPIKRNTDFSI